jgi:hypothetical protein
MADRLVLVRDLGHARTLPTWRTRLLTVHDPGRQLRRGRLVLFAGADLVHLEQDQPERLDALDQPIQRRGVSLTGSQPGSPRGLPQFYVIELGPYEVAGDSTDLELVYARTFRHLTSPGLSLCMALTPTIGCGWCPGITQDHPQQGEPGDT